jgi:hypothetical protein
LSCVEIEGAEEGEGCSVAEKFYKEEVEMREGERGVECQVIS